MANSMYIGASPSTFIDLSTYGVVVSDGTGPAMAAAQFDAQVLPGLDGGAQYSNQFGLRRWTIEAWVFGDDYDDTRENLDTVLRLLNPQSGDRYLKLDAQSDRCWLGRVCGEIGREPRGMQAIRLTIPWQCSRALAYSTTETTHTTTVNSDPEAWDEAGTGVAVEGTGYAQPVWVVKNTSGGTSSALVLQNTTTGEIVSTNTGLPNGHWARFDGERQIIEKSSDSGATWSAWMTARGSYRNIPRLQPGAVNAMTLTGLSAGSVVCTYRARYL